MELRFSVKYSKVFGIFRLKLAAEVESNMIRAISRGIPPGFTGLAITSSFGDTCICTSLLVFQNVVTSTRRKSALTVAFPRNGPARAYRKEIRDIYTLWGGEPVDRNQWMEERRDGGRHGGTKEGTEVGRHGRTEAWRHGGMEAWRHGGMEHGGMEAWRHGGMEAWRHGGMEAWRHGGMEAWRHGDI